MVTSPKKRRDFGHGAGQADRSLSSPATLDSTLERTIDQEADVVISGMSCRLPDSDTVAEFRDHLLAGRDMFTEDNEDGPSYTRSFDWGRLKGLRKFDADFFGISPKHANLTDPQLRMLLETTYEAMIDAGIDPGTLRGSRTGVYVGLNISHALEGWISNPENPNSYAAWGCTKNMFANRISYTFDLKGPSFAIQCSSAGSSVALDEAYHSMMAGEIDAAVVAGSSLELKEWHFWCEDVQPDMPGHDDTNGGDGVVVMILQKAQVAKRVYASILHSKAQLSQGTTGISYPLLDQQTSFLMGMYAEAEIDSEAVEYVEVSSVTNNIELEALHSATCVGRESPLLVGSLRSSIGNLEAAAGLASVTKALLTFEAGMIPATLGSPSLTHNNMEPVVENIPTDTSIISVNSLGYGGYHVHTILARNPKSKMVHYMASEKKRLCLYASTTEEGVRKALQLLQDQSEDMELHSLLNETTCQTWGNLPYRGYCILNSTDQTVHTQTCPGAKRPVWYVFSGMGTQWRGMGRGMLAIPEFCRTLHELGEVLQPHGLDLHHIITAGEDGVYDTALNSFVGIAAIQIALVDVLRQMKITPDGIVGHSVGEIASGYADGCLTAREAILAAYWRGRCIQEAGLPPGGMAAVGMSWKDAVAQCPPGVVAACHNSADTITISGPAADVTKFVGELKSREVFAREVRSAGVAFHSPHMQQVAPKLREALAKHIVGKPRSPRWISTSVPESRWGENVALDCSVEYLVNNLVSPVLFQEGLGHVPDNAIVLEIGPHDLLQAILRRSMGPGVCHVGLMKREHPDNVSYMFNSLGKCYMNGLKLDPLGIYPRVSYPVARRTPMLSPIVTWDHSKLWDLPKSENFLSGRDGKTSRSNFEINVGPDGKDGHLHGHLINGRAMFPASGYILLAWKALAKFHGMLHTDMAVVMENVEIHRATILPAEGILQFKVRIMRELGDFEVLENKELVCSGKIRRQTQLNSIDHTDLEACQSPSRKQEPQLTGREVYKELRLRGYQYLDKFQTIRHTDSRGESGAIVWTGDWVSFIDGMMQLVLISQPSPQLLLPTHLALIEISPKQHLTKVWSLNQAEKVVTAHVTSHVNSVVAGGIKLQGLGVGISKAIYTQNVLTQEVTFVPYVETVRTEDPHLNLQQYGADCVMLASQFICTAAKTLEPEVREKVGLDEIVKDIEMEKTSVEVKVKTKYAKLKNCPLISLLSMLTTLPEGKSFGENVRNLLDAFEEDVKTDALLSVLYTPNVLKSCLDVVLENLPERHLHVLHVAQDVTELHKHVTECLKDERLLRLEHSVLGTRAQSNERVPVPAARSLDWNLVSPPNKGVGPFQLVLVDNALSGQALIQAALAGITQVMADNGYIIIKEPTDNFHMPITLSMLRSLLHGAEHNDKLTKHTWLKTETWLDTFKSAGLELLSSKTDGHLSTMFLLRKQKQDKEASVENQTIVNVSSLDCSWVGELKERLAACEGRPAGQNLWIVADKQPSSGVLGMVRCLALEPGGSKVRCIFLEDACDVTVASLKETEIFRQLVQKDMIMNVYKDGHWGSYRHLPLQNVGPQLQTTTCACVELDGVQPVWVTTLPPPCPHDTAPDTVLCYPKFCLVDNIQAWTAGSQKHTLGLGDPETTNRFRGMGIVFSGHDHSGRRVMGAIPAQGVSTQLLAPKHHLWEVPAQWSLEQACSVPLAYATAYFALEMCTNLQKHQSILFCGSNLTSHAALTLAQHIGSKVFIVVETDQAKHELPKQLTDKLKPKQILLTKEGYFFSDVLQKTGGKGVDVVFDCDGGLCYENAAYSLRAGGTFLQLTSGTHTTSTKFEHLFQRCSSYCPINLGHLDASQEERLSHLFHCGLQAGLVKPLPITVVDKDKLGKAFSQTNKASEHVAIKLAEETVTGPAEVKAIKKLLFEPRKSYIIVGGLGGFGLELAEWMITKGATKLMLSSRSGVKFGYQARKLRLWRGQGVTVEVSDRDIATPGGAKELVEASKKLGPLGGVFNLAMVLQDGFLSTLTEESFLSVCAPKVSGTQNLDAVTRSDLCAKTLDYFVVFSSVTSGFGNPGQTNYGFANAAMEQICKQRKKDGLPGLAIQWGAIGDVGVVMDRFGGRDVAVGATLPQRLASCVATLETFLLAPGQPPVVTSFIPERYEEGLGTSGALLTPGLLQGRKEQNLFKTICKILGVKKSKVKCESKLVDLGLDSLMATEVRQIMERNHKKLLTADQVRELTIGEIRAMSEQHKKELSMIEASMYTNTSQLETGGRQKMAVTVWPSQDIIVKLNTVEGEGKLPVYVIYDEDQYDHVTELAGQLETSVYGLHATSLAPLMSVPSLAGFFVQKLFAQHNNNVTPFLLVGHKFGCPVAIELALQLQEAGLGHTVRNLVCVEGSHQFVPVSGTEQLHRDELQEKEQFERENEAMFAFISQHGAEVDDGVIEMFDDSIGEEDITVRIDDALDIILDHHDVELPNVTLRHSLEQQLYRFITRYLITSNYEPEDMYKGQITLIRGRRLHKDVKVAGDYYLSKVCSGGVSVHILNKEHENFLHTMKDEIVSILNATIQKITQPQLNN